MKSSQAEGNLCRSTILEKAIAFPEIQFQLLHEGKPKITLPPGTLEERAGSAYPTVFPPDLIREIQGQGAGYSFRLIHASPEIHRRDRRYIHVYLNKRRIQEYSLIQAVEYGFSMLMPGGSFPVALLLLEVDPQLVDFNIHPAKREARIRNLKEIHHGITSTLQQALQRPARVAVPPGEQKYRQDPEFFPKHRRKPAQRPSVVAEASAAARRPGVVSRTASPAPSEIGSWKERTAAGRPEAEQSGVRYLGQLFKLFLVCERGDRLYLVDQHAAHERILYNRFSKEGQESQGLMIPLEIEIESEEDLPLYRELLEKLLPLGFRGEISGEKLLIRALPASFRGVEKELTAFLTDAGGSTENFLRRLYADMACKAAVRDGEPLERVSAEELLRETFMLPEPRCPHGRPVWFELSRNELFALVGRT